jgi:ABC-type multidrug transport system fused ATPase/permease subunit
MRNDRIMVIDKGRIVEFGAPDLLVKDPNSIFSNIVYLAKIEWKNSFMCNFFDYK